MFLQPLQHVHLPVYYVLMAGSKDKGATTVPLWSLESASERIDYASGVSAAGLTPDEAGAIANNIYAYGPDDGIQSWTVQKNHVWDGLMDPTGAVVKISGAAPARFSPWSENWFLGTSIVRVLGAASADPETGATQILDDHYFTSQSESDGGAGRRAAFSEAIPEHVGDRAISLDMYDSETGRMMPKTDWTPELSPGAGNAAGVLRTTVRDEQGVESPVYYLFVTTHPRVIGLELLRALDIAQQRGTTVGAIFPSKKSDGNEWNTAQAAAECERATALKHIAHALEVEIPLVRDRSQPDAPYVARVLVSSVTNLATFDPSEGSGDAGVVTYYSGVIPTEARDAGKNRSDVVLANAPRCGYVHLSSSPNGSPWNYNASCGVLAYTKRDISEGVKAMDKGGGSADVRCVPSAKDARTFSCENPRAGVALQLHTAYAELHDAGYDEAHDICGHNRSWGRTELRPLLVKLASVPDYLLNRDSPISKSSV